MSGLFYVLSALVAVIGFVALGGFCFFAFVLAERALERAEFRFHLHDPRTLDPKDWTR